MRAGSQNNEDGIMTAAAWIAIVAVGACIGLLFATAWALDRRDVRRRQSWWQGRR